MENIKTVVTAIATEAIESAKLEANYYGAEVTASGLDIEISVAAMQAGIKFENATAEAIFNTVVKSEISKTNPAFYKAIYKPVFMDANGNYTTNPALWV